MFISVHSAIGVAVTSALGIHEPAMAFTVGWLLHYVADVVPHGDERLGSWALRQCQPIRTMALIFAADFLLAATSVTVIGLLTELTWPMVFAVAGSMVPDFLLGLEIFLGRRTLSWLTRFHVLMHKSIGFVYSAKYGLPLQAGLAILIWFSYLS
ncbi:MAG: hypothetical protein V1738_02630 [Patescibacteria group bacterium]